MKKLRVLFILAALTVSISCATKKKVVDDDFAVDSAEAGFTDADLAVDGDPDQSVSITEPAAPSNDEFSDFEGEVADATAPEAPPVSAEADETASLEQELNNISDESATAEQPSAPEVIPPVEVAETTPLPTEIPPPAIEETPITETPIAEEAPPVPSVVAKITNIQYKGNSNGGTVIISSDNPLNYTTRVNAAANQVVIEVQDATVANHLKRPLNTKDMSSSIGHVDVYQKKDSKTARFVIQLRPDSPEPLVQPEGNSLLIVGSAVDGSGPNPSASTQYAKNDSTAPSATTAGDEVASEGLMASDDLEEFLASNTKFFGKNISIETTDMDVRDILKLISEESGINMVFDDDISGKSTLKLRKVPWDQALVIILKSKRYGYRRQGSVLRIARVDTLLKEDADAVALKKARATVEPLIVRNFFINYAEIDKVEAKIKDFIANDDKNSAVNRGRVTSDSRTNTLIVTETSSKLEQIGALIKALDTQPQQVMIEARIIEASDGYLRSINGSLGFNRTPVGSTITNPNGVPGFNAPGRIVSAVPGGTNYSSPSIGINPSVGSGGSFLGNLFFGTIAGLGNLDAQLALDERENKVKILSSPRIAMLTNTTANINQGATILQKSTSSTPAAGGATTETFNPVKIGVNLKVTPQISNIGTVRLVLDVSRTSVSDAADNTIDDRSVKTEVIVKSGDTAVVGGVFQSDSLKTKQGVPGLKDIPILGTLFKGEIENNKKSELMIFVTPKIIPLINQVFKAEGETDSSAQ